MNLCKSEPKVLDEPEEPVNGYMEVTQEQRDELNEEPEMVTSNASKAVMGYAPQDDKRICKFYKQGTGGCFKGNQCRLEHVLPMKGE